MVIELDIARTMAAAQNLHSKDIYIRQRKR